MNLSKYSFHITTLVVLLLQNLSTTHMLPLTHSLDQLLDPVFQSEQEELETKIVVPKSVYNTVIRVTNSPCPPGTQRVKEGGPCVTRYSGSGPVLDEEYQLSILKGITSLGGLGTRRPNRNRNRHRTTTTTTSTTETPSTNIQDEYNSSEESIKTHGNIEMMDIDVDMAKQPQSEPVELSPTAQTSSSITLQPIPISIASPQEEGHKPTLPLGLPSSSSTTSSSIENDSSQTEIPPPTTTDSSVTGSKVVEDSESLNDFSTTMISIREDEVINVAFDTDLRKGNEELVDTETEDGKPLSGEEQASDQNVMVNIKSDSGKVINFPRPIKLTRPIITPIDSTTNSSSGSNFTFLDLDFHSVVNPVSETEPQTSSSESEVSSAPVPTSSSFEKETEKEELDISTSSPKPLNFTETGTDILPMTDLNTRAILPDLDSSENKNTTDDDHTQSHIISPLPSSSTVSTLIQINDFEIDPNSAQQESSHEEGERKIDEEVSIENITPTMSFAQHILERLQPNPKLRQIEVKQPQRSDIPPESYEDLDFFHESIEENKSQEAEIDKIHHRSRNRAKNLDISSTSHQSMARSLEHFSHPLFRTRVNFPQTLTNAGDFLPGAPIPKLLSGSSIDYQRLGSNYRRFRVF